VRNYYPLTKSYNRFERWYDQHDRGKGVWKWTQYFPAYERHLAKFIDRSWAGEEVHMAELGIFSGGSLEMWQNVFGPGLRLWGVDIALVTKQYEKDDKSGRTKIFNLDQTNAESWNKFKALVPKLDILIDDGLHLFTGQKGALDNILDHIAPGGVFMTEDISDGKRPGAKGSKSDGEAYEQKYLDYSYQKLRPIHYEGSHYQTTIDSIHYYPYLFVVEKRVVPLRPKGSGPPLAAIKHGTLWKPIGHGVVKGDHAQ
jgi:SAM-dependent methyltransferase